MAIEQGSGGPERPRLPGVGTLPAYGPTAPTRVLSSSTLFSRIHLREKSNRHRSNNAGAGRGPAGADRDGGQRAFLQLCTLHAVEGAGQTRVARGADRTLLYGLSPRPRG